MSTKPFLFLMKAIDLQINYNIEHIAQHNTINDNNPMIIQLH
ncbi:hypothetical protein VHA_000309 [Grimontia hollisae CIP 101886]|uniref:Uncharacterized protein n=1 Tax=Grimontia hollisae CIP 101886 TaxID=675812 RepID=D0I3J4_GRIHO|nr:hypothetical protein VHA_000309 [Grimontia hollisae CIP 101886]